MSSTTFQSKFGSKWWKIDFHVHTPASGDYGHGNQSVRDSTTPIDILQAAMSQQLDAIVVTDHNSNEWIDRLQQANKALRAQAVRPSWYRDLVIFPGVEISVSGGQDRIHVLAVFDPSVSGNTIAGLLGRCGILGNYGNERTTTTTTSMSDTIRHIFDAGAIPILAHVDNEKGYLHNISSLPDGGSVFQEPHRVFAAEFADLCKFDAHPSPAVRETVKALAKVGGSDAHLPEEIGRFSSWVKMSSPSLAAMRLALQSSDLSVKNQPDDPNREPNLFLQELTITDMKHCGRIKGQPCKVFFNPHQTSLIGGRGSGKSTIVESLRIALARENIPDASQSKVQQRIDSFMGQSSRQKKGVMLPSTTIELALNRNGNSFRIVWDAANLSHTILKLQDSEWVEDQGSPSERFQVIVLSQKQIEELADNPHGLLDIIDRHIEKRDWDDRWQQTRTEFLNLCGRKRELQRKLHEESALRAQLTDVESDLAQFEQRGDGEVLKHYQRRQLQWNALGEDNVFDDLSADIRNVAGKVSLPDFPSHLFDVSDSTLAEQKTLHDDISRSFDKLRAQLEEIAAQVDALKLDWTRRISESDWNRDVTSVTAKYNELVEEYKRKNSRLDMSVYNQWIVKRNSLISRLKQIESVKSELKSVHSQLSDTYGRFLELRRNLLVMRRGFIEKAIGVNQYVKITVVPFGDLGNLDATYRELLALEPAKYKEAILSDDKEGGILSELAKWNADASSSDDLLKLIASLKMNTMDIVRDKMETDAWLEKRLKAEYEQRPQSFDNLFSWFPEDSLRVQYSRNDSSGKFTDLEQGSAGQKAAAILAFLLSYGEEPIVIDQPEDDLDNALVYDLVVKQLHESKNRRQVIVATHNPNIVVNADSELVHVFHFERGQVKIAHSGGLDSKDIREDICTIMEGGKEAFERRYRRMEIDHV